MATNQFRGLDKTYFFGRGLLKEHFCKNFCQNICSDIPIKANCNFPHYKSMEILCCHSNESSWAMALKNASSEKECYKHLCKVSALSPLWLLRRWFLNIVSQFSLSCHGNQSNSEIWTKQICLVEDYSRNISVKLLSKYLHWDSNKYQFPFFPIISQWEVTIVTTVLIRLR